MHKSILNNKSGNRNVPNINTSLKNLRNYNAIYTCFLQNNLRSYLFLDPVREDMYEAMNMRMPNTVDTHWRYVSSS